MPSSPAPRETGTAALLRPRERTLWIWMTAAVVLALVTFVWTQVGARVPARGMEGRVYPRMAGSPRGALDVLRNLGVGSLTWYACLLAAPLFLWLTRRTSPTRARARVVVLHVVLLIGLAILTSVAQYQMTYGSAPLRPALSTFLSVATLANSIPLFAVAAAAQAFESWRRARDAELASARLELQLAHARLDAITTKLQPHFLFNALQGISTLIHRDPQAADAMLGQLSELLREVLRGDARQEIPLAEELRVLGGYLEISRRRLGGRLAVDVDVAPEASDALVPFFLLQPIVENALHHGVAARAAGGRIGIRAQRSGAELTIEVTDDGPGLEDRAGPNGRQGQGGIGLTNTRERLRQLYGEAHRFELSDRPEGGARVAIAIPFRRTEETAAGVPS